MSGPEVLERFHRALIEEIQTQRPEYLTAPFTVAEIYQNLVPYGSHRDRIGVEMNADYEDALLRLLAGEGEFLVLESVPALENIRAELGRSNPNTSVYREFAAVDVRLNPSRLDLSVTAIDEITDLAEELDAEFVPVSLDELAPPVEADAVGIVPPDVGIFTEGAGSSNGESGLGHSGAELPPEGGLQPEFVEPEPAEAPAPVRSRRVGPGEPCRWCRGALPERDTVNFCPYCGTNLEIVPCPSCGDEVEPDWRFCVSCGSEVDA